MKVQVEDLARQQLLNIYYYNCGYSLKYLSVAINKGIEKEK